ncbi:MAG TPA: hypothetical protein VKY85_07820 [Candidatus Angelobacter sp.]|nr:hypothetical protein [Candidatus Angelobacter sp.]
MSRTDAVHGAKKSIANRFQLVMMAARMTRLLHPVLRHSAGVEYQFAPTVAQTINTSLEKIAASGDRV